jgi:hypothetical protein
MGLDLNIVMPSLATHEVRRSSSIAVFAQLGNAVDTGQRSTTGLLIVVSVASIIVAPSFTPLAFDLCTRSCYT